MRIRLAVLLIILLLASACLPEDRIIALSPHWEGIKYELSEGFNRERRERGQRAVNFTWLDIGGTAEIVRFVRSEFERSPGGINIDILFGGGIDPFEEFSRTSLLEPVPVGSEILASIPSDLHGALLREPSGRWYAPIVAGFGIMCNTKVLDLLGLPQPRSWEDLAQDGFQSWISSADPGKSGSVHMSYEIILQAYGWEPGWNLIFRLARNIRDFPNAASQMAADVASGEVACSFSLDSQAWAMRQELGEDAISFVVPADLSAFSGDSIAALRGAPHPALAGEFIRYVLTPQAQRLFLYEKGSPGGPLRYNLFRLPVLPEAYLNAPAFSPVTINPFEWPTRFRYNSELGATRWTLINDMIRVLVIDRHAAIKKGDLPTLPLTEGEALSLAASGALGDQRARARLLSSWESSQGKKKSLHLPAIPLAGTLLFLMWFTYRRKMRRRRRL